MDDAIKEAKMQNRSFPAILRTVVFVSAGSLLVFYLIASILGFSNNTDLLESNEDDSIVLHGEYEMEEESVTWSLISGVPSISVGMDVGQLGIEDGASVDIVCPIDDKTPPGVVSFFLENDVSGCSYRTE